MRRYPFLSFLLPLLSLFSLCAALPFYRKRVSADGVRARGTHKEAKGRGARNPPDILANKGKEKDKPRQWGQKVRQRRH